MKKSFFLSLCLVAVFLAPHVSAQVSAATLTGSWQLTFSPTSPTPVAVPAVQFGGLATFISDFTVVETDTSELVPAVSTASNAMPATPGHGIWQRGPVLTNFHIQFVSLTPNKTGGVQSKKTITITGTLDSTGNTFHGSYNTQVTNPAGNTLSSTAGVVTFVRMVQPLLP